MVVDALANHVLQAVDHLSRSAPSVARHWTRRSLGGHEAMRWLVPTAVAMLLSFACRSSQPDHAMTTTLAPVVSSHRLVGCDETSRGPASPALKPYVGQRPLYYVTSRPSCDGLERCQVGYELVVFEDGLLAYEGAACGEPASRVVLRHLDRSAVEKLHRRLEGCRSLSNGKYSCSHGDRLSIACRTAPQSDAFVDDCDGAGRELRAFAAAIAQSLDLERIVSDRESCTKNEPRVPLDDLHLTVHPLRSRDCTYAPK
jgi:hypothetical protein